MNLPFTAPELAAALGPAFRIQESTVELLVTRPDNCAVAWVDDHPPAVRGVITVQLPEPAAHQLPKDDEAIVELQTQAYEAASKERRRDWEAAGFTFPDEGEFSDSRNADGTEFTYYRLWPSKPVANLAAAVAAIAWLAGREAADQVVLY